MGVLDRDPPNMGTPLCSCPMQRALPDESRRRQLSLCCQELLTVGVFQHLVARWLHRDILEDSGDRERRYFQVQGGAYPRSGIGSWQQDKLSQQALGKREQQDVSPVRTRNGKCR